MSKRQVEIEDTLEERTQDARDYTHNLLVEYLDENPDFDSVPCLHNDLDYDGRVHEIVDGRVPIYTSEIEDTWYLYSSELEEAYESAGFGSNPRENNGMTAIYCYIHSAVCEWYDGNAEEIFQDWRNAKCLSLLFFD